MQKTKHIEKTLHIRASVNLPNNKKPSMKPRFTLENLFIKKKRRDLNKNKRMSILVNNLQKDMFSKTDTTNQLQMPMIPAQNQKKPKKSIKRTDFSKSKT
jgi:hypothetical protein